MSPVHHRTVTVDGHEIFYRDAGPADAPVIVLLHGYPTSSFMFRELIPLLGADYHVVAPDHLGFGHSAAPPSRSSATPSTPSPISPPGCSTSSA